MVNRFFIAWNARLGCYFWVELNWLTSLQVSRSCVKTLAFDELIFLFKLVFLTYLPGDADWYPFDRHVLTSVFIGLALREQILDLLFVFLKILTTALSLVNAKENSLMMEEHRLGRLRLRRLVREQMILDP